MKMFDYFWENFLCNMILDCCLFLEVLIKMGFWIPNRTFILTVVSTESFCFSLTSIWGCFNHRVSHYNASGSKNRYLIQICCTLIKYRSWWKKSASQSLTWEPITKRNSTLFCLTISSFQLPSAVSNYFSLMSLTVPDIVVSNILGIWLLEISETNL